MRWKGWEKQLFYVKNGFERAPYLSYGLRGGLTAHPSQANAWGFEGCYRHSHAG